MYNYTLSAVGQHPEWEFEKIDSNKFSKWLTENYSLVWTLSATYLFVIYAGKRYMEDKPRFQLRQPMMLWSLLLAIFSILGTARSGIVMYHIYLDHGLRGVICSDRFYLGPIARFWGPAFVVSKILEYIDTMFIILRKQKLMFLHWYHHASVSLFSWWVYGAQFAGGGVFMTVNFFIHSLMYSYYAVRAAGFRVQRSIALVITASQIVQMVIGCRTMQLVNRWRPEPDCRSTHNHVLCGVMIYFSYLVLFLHFFYHAYVEHKPPPPPQAKPTTAELVTRGGGDGDLISLPNTKPAHREPAEGWDLRNATARLRRKQ